VTNRRWFYVLVLVLMGAGWGATQPLGKIAVSTGHRHFGLIFWQLVVGALVLGAVLAVRRKRVPLTGATLRFAVLIALIGTVIPNSTFYYSVAHLPSGVMSILISTIPLMALPIALALGTDRFSMVRLAGLLCGLLGVILIAAPKGALPDAGMVAYLPVALIGPLFYAFESNYVARFGTAGMDAVQAMFLASTAGTLIALPLALGTGQFIDPLQPWSRPEFALVASSVVHSFAYVSYVWLAARVGAVFASQTSYIVTGTGVIWAMIFLGERFSPFVWAAMAVMLLGLTLVRPREKTPLAV
jgi:drug/metabolite transporter (DMT)-like permease